MHYRHSLRSHRASVVVAAVLALTAGVAATPARSDAAEGADRAALEPLQPARPEPLACQVTIPQANPACSDRGEPEDAG